MRHAIESMKNIFGEDYSSVIGKIGHDKCKELNLGIYSPDFVPRGFTEEERLRSKSDSAIAKKKETFAKTGHQQGEKNSQAGTMWITNDVENKKIKKTDLIPQGFRKGRKYSKLN